MAWQQKPTSYSAWSGGWKDGWQWNQRWYGKGGAKGGKSNWGNTSSLTALWGKYLDGAEREALE
eukprot:10733806-Prorocentrum_lima.AAC.1